MSNKTISKIRAAWKAVLGSPSMESRLLCEYGRIERERDKRIRQVSGK